MRDPRTRIPKEGLAIRRRFPSLPIVIVSGVSDARIIRTLIDSGARGFIPKLGSSEQLMDGLRRVMQVEVYLPDSLFLPAADGAAGGDSDLLTSRQLQLLPLLADGMPNKRIADALGVTEGTVKQHLK